MSLPLFITFCYIFMSFMLPALTAAATTTDSLSATVSLRDGQTLVSSNQFFEFGFFSPGNSTKRYIGIWYKNLPLTVVWVANRNTPITGDLANIMVTKGGSLLVSNGTDCVWHVDPITIRPPKNPVLQLLDSGNLVLRDNGGNYSEVYLWQSFDYPSNTLLPGMKLGWNLKTGFNRFVTTWKSSDDPAPGEFTFSLETPETPQLVLRKSTVKQYRWGPWDGVRFSGSSGFKANPVFQPTFVFNANECYYIFTVTDKSLILRYLLSSQGSIQLLKWRNYTKEWVTLGALEIDYCDKYGVCGPYGSCYMNDPECRCLKGFEPKSPSDWDSMDWSGGCTRKLELDCGDGEGFVKFEGMKLPDHPQLLGNRTLSPEECEAECLKNCSCMAYSNINVHENGGDCVVWYGNLTDIRDFPLSGEEIYIRMARAELEAIAEAKRKMREEKVSIIIISIFSGVFLFVVGWYFFHMEREARRALNVIGASQDVTENLEEDLELPLFDLLTISAATNQFSEANKIGRGGFGSVYKGVLPNGEEIAVKRLSQTSGQGLQEFKNEVLLIANLQHRNLVKLLGCCIQRDDRILVYEYLPNKSLDYFLFDQTRNNLLKWPKRLNIIFGIARGLLYLHQDSRLRIIHRDLKASNILLDGKMDPKISDFGTARVFGGDQTEEMTKTVIGTYGYMSPEYALSGQFSVKSDVFSFGVLLLEIVSGKKNWGFSHPGHDQNLIGYAWKLWNEGNPLELLDHLMEGSFCVDKVVTCIQVGLLCVQQLADDRPTMSSVIHMLNSESSTIPLPKEPGFFVGHNTSLNVPNVDTVNQVTITDLDPR